MLTRERMRELIEEHGLSDRADEIMTDARPSIHLTLRYDVDEADIPIGASKMGGSPDVPADFEWPMWNGNYLSFIAQIRLSDAKPFDLENLLPETGMLYFFCEIGLWFDYMREPDGVTSSPYRVIYVNDETLSLNQMPHLVSKYLAHGYHQSETEVFEVCPIAFEQEWTLPPQDSIEGYWGKHGLWRPIQNELAKPMHRLLGVETDIQVNYSMMDDASKAWNLGSREDWILLLQVDTDVWRDGHFKPGFAWGDMGLIYFCINKEDLYARRFDRIWLEMIDY